MKKIPMRDHQPPAQRKRPLFAPAPPAGFQFHFHLVTGPADARAVEYSSVIFSHSSPGVQPPASVHRRCPLGLKVPAPALARRSQSFRCRAWRYPRQPAMSPTWLPLRTGVGDSPADAPASSNPLVSRIKTIWAGVAAENRLRASVAQQFRHIAHRPGACLPCARFGRMAGTPIAAMRPMMATTIMI